MASKVIPITNLTQFGVVKDTPTVGLAPNVFTDARNIRFRDMAAHKMKGDVALSADLTIPMPSGASHTYTAGQIVFITWWNNPNLVTLYPRLLLSIKTQLSPVPLVVHFLKIQAGLNPV